MNDTQLEVYAKCQAEQERASNRGRKGAQARAQGRAQGGAQAPTQAPTQVGAQATPEHLLKDNPPDPDPEELSEDQESSRRVRARAFTGTRLKVSRAQHELVRAESGLSDAALSAAYPQWDADIVATGETFDTLAYLKQRAGQAVQAPPREPEVDWAEECKGLHDGKCGGQFRHHNRMLMDAEKAKAVNA